MNKLQEVEKKLITMALDANGQDKAKAAKDLGISVDDLNRKIVIYNIGITSSIEKTLSDPNIPSDDRDSVMDVFGKSEPLPVQKKKKKNWKRWKKSNGGGYKEKYLKLLKDWKRLTD